MAHEKVAVPAVEFALGALLARALLPRTYRRDMSEGELQWHRRVLRLAGISNPCDSVRDERRRIPRGGLGDHTFFQGKSEKRFVREDLKLAAHRQQELGEPARPRPRDADPADWGPGWLGEAGDVQDVGTCAGASAGPSSGASAEAPAVTEPADQSDLINMLLTELHGAKEALKTAAQQRSAATGVPAPPTELPPQWQGNKEIKRERSRSRRGRSSLL